MNPEDIIRRLIWLAYNTGWRNACDDHLIQNGTPAEPGNPNHPIGTSMHGDVDSVLGHIDPSNITGLR